MHAPAKAPSPHGNGGHLDPCLDMHLELRDAECRGCGCEEARRADVLMEQGGGEEREGKNKRAGAFTRNLEGPIRSTMYHIPSMPVAAGEPSNA